MEEVRTATALYDLDDIYNMDETGLFWKGTPDASLVTNDGDAKFGGLVE